MRFFCPGCGAMYSKPEAEIPKAGIFFPCQKCGYKITVRPAQVGAEPLKPTSAVAQTSATGPISATSTSTRSRLATSKAAVRPTEAPAEEPILRGPGGDEEMGFLKRRVVSYLGSIGTGRSSSTFRFRDLLCALAIPLDFRKLLAVGVFVFVGLLLFAGLVYLGLLTKSSVAYTISLIISSVILWALIMLGLGVTSYLTDREMEEGKRLPLSIGVRFVFSKPLAVLGTPLVFVLGIVVLVTGVVGFSLIGRIPSVGPIVYGLSSIATFALGFAAVLLGISFGLTSFSYLPAVTREGLNPLSGAMRLMSMIRNNVGQYLLHVVVAGMCAVALSIVLGFLVRWSLSLVFWLGSGLMGQNFASILRGLPLGLFGLLVLMMPNSWLAILQTASDSGWQFNVAGWLVWLTLVVVFSLVLAFVLVYLFGAGVVNYHLLVQREKKRPGMI